MSIIKRFLIVSFASSIAMAGNAFANDQSPSGLPGVKAQKPIVSAPPPAPEPDQKPAGNWKNFRVGNTDVSISGDIIIDVGTGHMRSSSR